MNYPAILTCGAIDKHLPPRAEHSGAVKGKSDEDTFRAPQVSGNLLELQARLEVYIKNAVHPPLGLLTIAAMLPENWEKKLVDMNTALLRDKDLQWADYVFIGAMAVQKESAWKVIDRLKKTNVKIVAGGPLFTAVPENYPDIDHLTRHSKP